MTKTTRKKQQFQSQAHSALRGVQVVSKAAPARAEQAPVNLPAETGTRASNAALIQKLIEFFKEME